MDGARADTGVDALRAGVDQLLSGSLSGLSSVELAALVADVEVQRRRLESVDQRLLAEVTERGMAGEYARTSTADLLVTLLRVSPGEAKARVARARDIGPRRALTGEALPPMLPVVAAAMRAGQVSGAQAGVITACIERIPGDVAHEVAPVAEQFLVQAAGHEHPKALARTAALLLARVDPDGAEPHDREIERRRAFRLIKRPDGTSTPHGQWDPETTAAWETILDSLAAPVPAADGMPDERTPDQRRHDAMAEAARRLLRSGSLPAAGGMPVTVLAAASITDLIAGTGLALTGHGDPISIQQVLAMAGDARVVPVIFDEAGGVLAYGRGRRLASQGQRLALAARDGGCCFPGCERPPAWTETHHVVPWLDGGPTDLDNLCLLCRYHHREFERRGWAVQMTGGRPEWIPPPWLDPDRRPIRNTAHHQRDVDFRDAAGCPGQPTEEPAEHGWTDR